MPSIMNKAFGEKAALDIYGFKRGTSIAVRDNFDWNIIPGSWKFSFIVLCQRQQSVTV